MNPRFNTAHRIPHLLCCALGASAFIGAFAACPPQEDTLLVKAAQSNQESLVEADALLSTYERVPILSDVPVLGHFFTSRGAVDGSGQAAIDENAVATLLIALDENNEVLQVLINNVEVAGEWLRHDDAHSVEIVAPEGEIIADLRLAKEPARLTNLLTAQLALEQPRVRIGITMEDLPPPLAAQLRLEPDAAVVIADVTEGGPAQRAGLQRFDVVTAVDGERPVTQDSLRAAVQSKSAGDTITFTVVREAQQRDIAIEVEHVEQSQTTLNLSNREVALQAIIAQQHVHGDLRYQRPVVTTYPMLELPTSIQVRDPMNLKLDEVTYQTWARQNQDLGSIEWQLVQQPRVQTIEPSHRLAAGDAGLRIDVQPRIIGDRVVLDTVLHNPTLDIQLEAAADADEARSSPAARLRSEIESLRQQLQRLEAIIAEMEETEAGDE